MFPTISRIRNALRSRTQAEPAAARALPGVVSFDVFISHSTRDKTIADAVCAALENAAICCRIAPRDVVPGSDWGASIVEAIDRCRAMVLIFSSSAKNSPQIRNELVQAANRGAPIIPLRIENVLPTKSISYFVSGLH